MIQIIFSTLDPCFVVLQHQRRHRGGWRERVCSGNLDHLGAQRLLSEESDQRNAVTLLLTELCTVAIIEVHDTWEAW